MNEDLKTVLLVGALIVALFVIFILGAKWMYADPEDIKVDNTKKRIVIATVQVLECTQNETMCTIIQQGSNRTDLGNINRPMRDTRL